MCFLTGVLIGSLKKVWPWKEVLESVTVRGKVRVLRDQNVWPLEYGPETFVAMGLVLVGFIFVLLLENRANKSH